LAAAARDAKARAVVGPLLREAGRAGLRIAVSKGFHWAERLYDEPGLRPYLDVDLFVHPSEWRAFLDLLGATGFRPEGPAGAGSGPGRPRREWACSPVFHKAGLAVEAHPNPLGLQIPAVNNRLFWDSLRPVRLAGEAAWVPSWPHELVYAALHAQQHSYARLSWLVDLAEMAGLPGLDWDEATSIVRGEGLLDALAHGLRLAERCWPGSIPAPARRLMAAEGGAVRRACLFFWPPEAIAVRRRLPAAPYYMPSLFALLRRGRPGPALRGAARILWPPRGWIRRQVSGAGRCRRTAYAAGRWLRPIVYLVRRLIDGR